jgi:uncharacterized protein (DUF488 family)
MMRIWYEPRCEYFLFMRGIDMVERPFEKEKVIFTIGHSNHSADKFIRLLKENHIDVLVDVRSHPQSLHAPHFNKEDLKSLLISNEVKYLFLGKELGGLPEGKEFYDEKGYVQYSRIAENPLFLAGISRLEKGMAEYRIGIMCSEESPLGCHRRLLISRVLEDRLAYSW